MLEIGKISSGELLRSHQKIILVPYEISKPTGDGFGCYTYNSDHDLWFKSIVDANYDENNLTDTTFPSGIAQQVFKSLFKTDWSDF